MAYVNKCAQLMAASEKRFERCSFVQQNALHFAIIIVSLFIFTATKAFTNHSSVQLCLKFKM